MSVDSISIVLPCLNEAENLKNLLPKLKAVCQDAEILVVNDGSTDETLMVCQAHSIRVISHPYRMGNGAAIKTGARHADGDIIVFMDSDGQHNPDDIAIMLAKLAEGYDMVIGA
ncbi:MAG: glycosyltransferase family 2 protein, partial [Methylococcales bacterium]|nr:glycosyltransferase family 2 protein [Methylococcales bacterium]